MAKLVIRLRDLDRWLPRASNRELGALATALRYAAGVMAALEYELRELATASDQRISMPADDRTVRLTAVARDALDHVERTTRRCDDVARAYRDTLAPWFAAMPPADARAPTAFFETFLRRAEPSAKVMAKWTAASASAVLDALRARKPQQMKRMAARAEIVRRSLVRGLRALARVQVKIARIDDHPIPPGAIKIPVPEVRQGEDWSCGASSLQAVCAYFGVGPEEEWEISRDVGCDHRIGAHPFQIVRTARGYGLETEEIRDQADTTQVRALVDGGRPVLLMIQAWGDPDKYRDDADYAKVWNEGHWVVAIGYDSEGLFFEDPSLAGVRGYLSKDELEVRWRDTGPHNRYIPGFGIAMWKANSSTPAYSTRARHID